MPEPHGPQTDDDALMSEALDWLLALESADEDCRERFQAWLAASSEHAAAFQRAQRSWQSPLLGEAAQRLATARQAAVPRRRRLRRYLAVAASVLLLLSVAVQRDMLLDVRADHVTAVGQRQGLDLADGSHVTLNTDTAFSSQIDDQRRVANLLRGEAYFDVTPDSSRPFEVNAGPIKVSVLGTAFAVRYQGDEAWVSVEHGSVEVHAQRDGARIQLGDGDSIRIGPDGIGRRERDGSAGRFAWVQGRLVFDDQPLGEVLAELRRYYPGWIVSTDPRLNGVRVTGNYRLSDPLSVVRSLAQVTSATLHEYPALLVLN
ncbi:glycerol-3-phosphate ABC transporter substrate-binding protein [Halopseudomonas oceani]|uniref:Glycerol-3-phosphate ABC transporter substrate-binding protein n=1 Tax=Halopseudomonas oceani TaxID=1708783 RepID=A0A2P4EYD7_9GAMM|nr:FecR domain-containing protein [Halopseudomonas oceani]POB05237.1 glycerol-3-phosphate ABC transporter substrate-binding protein [Halopseudomonas oceani]GGE34273.1 glycerol-3-phosphate ABC transporter substrate-binding protein [Halopseudomonas oceani]